MPTPGALTALMREAGVSTDETSFPVLRRSLTSPLRVVSLAAKLPRTLWRLARTIRQWRPDVVYVNTVTIPWWIVAARLCRVPVIAHVHEAEESESRLVRWALAAPLLLATDVVTNSAASRRALLAVIPRLAARTSVIYNGIAAPDPATDPPSERASVRAGTTEVRPTRLTLVARLSARKGVDVALDALGLLRSRGHHVELRIYGTVFPGYEWFEDGLRERATRDDVRGAVHFHGYVYPTWPVLAESDIVLVPSRSEPFGNTAVEAMLAGRAVVASRVQGLAEIIRHGETGLLTTPGDPDELAAAIEYLLENVPYAGELARRGQEDARRRFPIAPFHEKVASLARATAGGVVSRVGESGVRRG